MYPKSTRGSSRAFYWQYHRGHHLPQREKGYYHEYTVVTPGAGNRSTKRIVTGGTPLRDPAEYFYTSDHYESFCQVPDAGRRQ